MIATPNLRSTDLAFHVLHIPTLPVGGLYLLKVLKNITNMFSKYNTFTGTFGMKLYTI
jgi:hypothetical protein